MMNNQIKTVHSHMVIIKTKSKYTRDTENFGLKSLFSPISFSQTFEQIYYVFQCVLTKNPGVIVFGSLKQLIHHIAELTLAQIFIETVCTVLA